MQPMTDLTSSNLAPSPAILLILVSDGVKDVDDQAFDQILLIATTDGSQKTTASSPDEGDPLMPPHAHIPSPHGRAKKRSVRVVPRDSSMSSRKPVL